MAARIRRDDIVVAMAGKDKGKRGKVLKVLPKKGRVIVEGINIIKRHTRQRKQEQPGGIISREASIEMSNLMPYCSKCGRGVRVGASLSAGGAKKRVCRRCGEEL